MDATKSEVEYKIGHVRSGAALDCVYDNQAVCRITQAPQAPQMQIAAFRQLTSPTLQSGLSAPYTRWANPRWANLRWTHLIAIHPSGVWSMLVTVSRVACRPGQYMGPGHPPAETLTSPFPSAFPALLPGATHASATRLHSFPHASLSSARHKLAYRSQQRKANPHRYVMNLAAQMYAYRGSLYAFKFLSTSLYVFLCRGHSV